MSTYQITFHSNLVQEPVTHKADDAQITPQTIKLLNGKGANAKLVAFYPTDTVRSVVVVD